MDTKLDEARRRLELMVSKANTALTGFKAEISNDIRPEVQRFLEDSVQKLREQLNQATTELETKLAERLEEEQRKLTQDLKGRLELVIVLSLGSLIFSFLSFFWR